MYTTSGNSERMKSGDLSRNISGNPMRQGLQGSCSQCSQLLVAPLWLILSRNPQKSKANHTSHTLSFLPAVATGE